jgi:protocatechuate 3,4-dioxygenase, beta subunit
MNSSHLVRQLPPAAASRRLFLHRVLLGSATLFTVPGAFAEELVRTPRQTEGPFYPNRLPLDTDNDLVILNDTLTPAVGEITHLTGRVLDQSGNPVRNASIEIWQVDGHGVYLHTNDRNHARRDTHFQGYGRFLTSSSGEYYFRTIKPVPYPGRTPHIHYKISRGSSDLLTTQCYIRDHPLNERDNILRGIRDTAQRDSLLVDFTPIHSSRIGELNAHFDIVLGMTPGDLSSS